MDCDFSHDPADVPRLIAAAEDGADLVLGSRYVPGGSIPNWGAPRRFISLGGNIYAQVWLASRLRDLTGGFKCFRRRVLETIDARRDRLEGLRVPDRDDLPRAPRRLPRRGGPDRVRRPRARPLEDEPRDRARGDLEGAAAAASRARRTSVASVATGRATSPTRASSRTSSTPGGRSWSTSGRPGGAVQGGHPALEGLAEESEVEFVAVVERFDIDGRRAGSRPRGRATCSWIPTVILFARRPAPRLETSCAPRLLLVERLRALRPEPRMHAAYADERVRGLGRMLLRAGARWGGNGRASANWRRTRAARCASIRMFGPRLVRRCSTSFHPCS